MRRCFRLRRDVRLAQSGSVGSPLVHSPACSPRCRSPGQIAAHARGARTQRRLAPTNPSVIRCQDRRFRSRPCRLKNSDSVVGSVHAAPLPQGPAGEEPVGVQQRPARLPQPEHGARRPCLHARDEASCCGQPVPFAIPAPGCCAHPRSPPGATRRAEARSRPLRGLPAGSAPVHNG